MNRSDEALRFHVVSKMPYGTPKLNAPVQFVPTSTSIPFFSAVAAH